MNQIHVNLANKQLGPFSVDEVNEKLDCGEFSPSNEGWMEGMSGWKPLSDSAFFTVGVKTPASDDGPPAISKADKMKKHGREAMEGAGKMVANIKAAKDVRDFLPYLKLVDVLLDLLKNMFSLKVLDTWDGAARKIGLLASAGCAVIMLVFGIINSIKVGEAEPALYHALFLPAVAIAQFIAVKFLGAGRNLIDKSPGQISSKAFLECFALILALGAVGIFSWGAFTSIKAGEFLPIVAGLGLAMILLYGVGASLNHESVNMELRDDTSIGEEAIGLFAFYVKFFMRLVPFIFGVASGVAFIGMAYSLIMLIGAEGLEAGRYIHSNYEYFGYMVWALMLPLIAYLTFLFYYLFIDLTRAILCLFQLKEK